MTLAANLSDLYRMGYEDIPYLADHVRAAADDCWTLRSNFGAFMRPAGLGGGQAGFGAWTSFAVLGNALEDILVEESKNLRAMGRAVADCAQAYASVDEATQTAFAHQTKDLDRRPNSMEGSS